MGNSNFPGGFANGVTVRGMSVLNTYGGNVFWVDSGTGSNGNKGTFDRPFGTIDYTVGRCTADNGDTVMVKAGHVETVSAVAGLALDVAGVTFIGLGNGANRPQINFTTDADADMDVDAANCAMINFLFTGGIDVLTGPIDINAADFSLIDCETRDVTGQATDFIVTDANADRLLIDGWKHRGASAAGADTAITIVGGDDITIRNFWIDGNFAVACIENVGTAAVNLTVASDGQSFARTRNAADVIFTAVATTTGNVGPNINARLQDDAANITEAFVGDAMQFFNPIRVVNADGERHIEWNGTQSSDT